MTNILIILSFFIIPFSYAQSGVEFSYNDVYIGRNFSLQWVKKMNKTIFHVGPTYHVNRIDKIPYGTLIKKSAFETNFANRFGVQFGLEYFFFQNEHFQSGIFYNNQTSIMDQKFIKYIAIDTLVSNPQSEADLAYQYYERDIGPFITVDNVIGLTLHCNLTNNFYFKTKGGLGFLLWKNTDDSVILIGGKKNNQSYNFSSFFSIGLGYTFNK